MKERVWDLHNLWLFSDLDLPNFDYLNFLVHSGVNQCFRYHPRQIIQKWKTQFEIPSTRDNNPDFHGLNNSSVPHTYSITSPNTK
jgi:hypothetical protein